MVDFNMIMGCVSTVGGIGDTISIAITQICPLNN